MNGLNGIIVDGKVYEMVEENGISSCKGCAFRFHFHCDYSELCMKHDKIFRYSQSLTDKINEK